MFLKQGANFWVFYALLWNMNWRVKSGICFPLTGFEISTAENRFVWHSSTVLHLIYPCVKNNRCFYKLSLFQDVQSSVLIMCFDRNGSSKFLFFLPILQNQNHL